MAKKVTISQKPDLKQTITPELLGQAVKLKRTQSNLKLTDAAALCRVSKQTYNNIEKGYPTTQLNTILQVCASLGLKLYILDNYEVADKWY